MTEQTRLDLGSATCGHTYDKTEIASRLLAWYDEHARVLAWRVSPVERARGQLPDPYRVWLSEIMLQQTTVATVKTRFAEFTAKWATVKDMGAAAREDILGAWAGLGYYARARNLHACAQIVSRDFDGVFPQSEDDLRALPGIGDYTAAAIAAIAFDKRAIVLDGNIERVTARLYAEDTALPKAKPILKKLTDRYWPGDKHDDRESARHGDFAQALMDLGATICKPKNPICEQCPIRGACTSFDQGNPQDYPVKLAKKTKPTRRGFVFILENARGEIAVEQRPDKGLLGGMLGLPGSDWTTQRPAWSGALVTPPDYLCTIYNKGQPISEIRHTFTHFHLTLDVYYHRWPGRRRLPAGLEWYAPTAKSLPTVMQKALDCQRA